MSKYIIKNCPAFEQNSYKNRDWAIENACTDIDDRCCIKHNCVMKQIVELCKEYWEDMTVSKFQAELLNKLDIEEIK